jgi:rod shape-determining protein MreC
MYIVFLGFEGDRFLFRLFKNKVFVFILITIIILISISVSVKKDSKLHYISDVVSVPIATVQSFFSYIGKQIEGSITFLSDAKALKKENEELKSKVDELENEKRNLLRYEKENKDLRAELDLKDQFNDYDYVGGNIIAKDAGNWFNIFTIDRGNSDAITINSPVITSRGLVGSIMETGPFTSKVLSIIDTDSTVSAIVSKSLEPTLVKGDLKLKNQGLCKMEFMSIGLDIKVGDKIETSGIGSIYPRGILIGKVKQIVQTNNELTRYAIIEPAVDFKRLQEVGVLKSKVKNTGTGSEKK